MHPLYNSSTQQNGRHLRWITEKETTMSLVFFFYFKDMFFSVAQVSASVAESCRWLFSVVLLTDHCVLLSTYFTMLALDVRRSLVWMRKHTGPRRVPWGTPTLTPTQSDSRC